MTRKRNDKHSTEFGLWLREQECIDSGKGYIATNLDYVSSNYRTGEWLLLEEKRYNKNMTRAQTDQFKILHDAAKSDSNYKGFHLIVFEKTSPADGGIKINNESVTVIELLNFLMFNDYREHYFDQKIPQ